MIPNYRRDPVCLVRGEGSWVWDVEGRRYLDLGSGIAVTNTGHGHPHVVDVTDVVHAMPGASPSPVGDAAGLTGRMSGSGGVDMCPPG